ncbi:MAG: hypothetical protein M3N22_07255 [Acidobacteriota bacterium]|nr:hypothetical protein [Acidobacteriota bacterium]
MSTPLTASTAVAMREDPERGHRLRLWLAWLASLAVVLVIAGYGLSYYTLSMDQRPFSPKHDALRPSGPIGVKLGMLGVLMFFVIYLYPIRKKWGWLARQGNSRHWLDFHIVLGTTAPIIIAFHASFKFGNIAGMAFYSMMAVTLSGFVGRYLYSQIPRSLNAAELTKKEMEDNEEKLHKELAEQEATFGFRVEALYVLPTAAEVAKRTILGSLFSMFFIDFRRPFVASRVRLKRVGFGPWALSLFGLFATSDHEIERALRVAKTKTALSKRILFLSRTQQVFNLWHVIHRPFSYAFAILAIIHIALVLVMGYRV